MTFNTEFLCKIISILLCSFLVLSCVKITSNAANTDIARLQNGEAIAKSLSDNLKPPLRGAEAKILIDAPVEKVWGIIDDQENLTKIVPKFKKITVLEKNKD